MTQVTTRELMIEVSSNYLAEPLPVDWDVLTEYDLSAHILDFVDSVYTHLRPVDVMFLITLSARSMERFLETCGIGVLDNTRSRQDDSD